MKKIMAMILLVVAVFASVSVSAADIKVLFNGEEIVFDQGPVMDGETVLIPLRFVVEKLGAIVSWHEETQTIFSVAGESIVTLQIGNERMFTAEKAYDISKAPVIVNDRTLITPEVIENGFGAVVAWDSASNTVTINK